MESLKNTIITLAIIALVIAAVIASGVTVAKANPSYFVRNSSSSSTNCTMSASTSVAYMTAGRATTTLTLNAVGCGSSRAIDSAALMLYRNASAPGTRTRIKFEFSDDCDASTGGSWYAPVATSTDYVVDTDAAVNSFNAITWQFASTTIGGGVAASDSDTLLIPIRVPTKCVRAVLTVPIGAASSSIWGALVGKQETN